MYFMNVPSKHTELSLDEALDFLSSARESLELSISWASSRQEFAIASLLQHVIDCLDSTFKRIKAQKSASYPSGKSLIERGGR
jgi:hypothetical protein